MGDLSRICLVSASGQNVFFEEIAGAFCAALREQGLTVEESVDCFPPPAEDLVYLYIPHEYHPLVQPLSHPTPSQLRRSVAICTEQPGTPWFEMSCEVAAQTGGAIDINALGAEEMRRRGIAVTHTPLGYVPGWDVWEKQDRGERPVDLVFLGGHTDRRSTALARCAPAMTQRRAEIHVTESVQPHTAGSPFLSHDRKWNLLADSRVILNVHRDDLAYMEWHRVIGAILNGCVVLSEHSLGVEPLVPGEHFVSAAYDDLHKVLEALLDEPERLDGIRHAAYDLVRDQMRMAASVDGLLLEIERAAGNPVPPPHPGASATAIPMPAPPPARLPDWEAYRVHAWDSAPMRMALKHLVIHTRTLERRLDEMAGESDGEDTVEHLGPDCPEPRISVLLTVHNYSDYVGNALRSVALSDLRDVEVVAVDDASTDDSVEAVRAAASDLPWLPVTLVRRARNRGLPHARNVAMEHARADLLFILDADNAVLPHGLRKLAQALDANPGAHFAYGVTECFGIAGPEKVMNWLDWDPERLRYGNYVDAMAMIRRSALEAVGGYPTEASLHGWEDFAVWIAMASAGMRGIRVPDFVARYRISSHSMLSLSDIDVSAAWATLLRKYPTLATPAEPVSA